jgi:hypothetical protein
MMSAEFDRKSLRTEIALASADPDIAEALRLARDVCELIERAAPASGPNGHSLRIAHAVSESLVTELEVLVHRASLRPPRRA